jgi:hypothetical protein
VDQFVDLLYLRLGVSNIPIVFMTLDAFVVVFLIFLFLSSVEIPENGGDHLLLSEEFLKNCFEMFSVLPRGLETNSRAFPQKHLNIIDPLKENNNLGRSVNRGRGCFLYILMHLVYA